ncbi:Phosphatidylinositol 3,4,5-trisphosphate 3-phosphatase tpte2, variant 2 [Balamuthia mandrillaris]
MDGVLLIVDLADGGNHKAEEIGFILTCLVLSILSLELLLRVVAYGKKFFRSFLNLLDATILVVSLILLLVLYHISRYLFVGRVIRAAIRVFRILFYIYDKRVKTSMAVRRLVGENKQRFQQDGFDLDLAYVTDRMIVMSVPATKVESLYRNHINDVVRFFNTRHGGHYRIYNMCAERDYSHAKFQDQVVRCPVEDHNVPSLTQMVELCQNAAEWLGEHAANVIAVHCRGGKGRSGTVICANLLWSGECATADEALALFAQRRTDREKGTKNQGVETQSQRRYVRYFEWVCKQNGGQLPPSVPQMQLDAIRLCTYPSLEYVAKIAKWNLPSSEERKKRMKLNLMKKSKDKEDEEMVSIMEEGSERDNGEKNEDETEEEVGGRGWKFVVTHTNGERLAIPYVLRLSSRSNPSDGELYFEGALSDVFLRADTRIECVGRDSKGRKRILFYFWFHTSFMESHAVPTPSSASLSFSSSLSFSPGSPLSSLGASVSSDSNGLGKSRWIGFDKDQVDYGRTQQSPFRLIETLSVELALSNVPITKLGKGFGLSGSSSL